MRFDSDGRIEPVRMTNARADGCVIMRQVLV